jgi:asparagine synthase (glutamine-hydrolysing)
MCGIGGIFAYRSTADAVRPDELEKISAWMIPRGPDAHGTWFSPDARIGLASRRLAIIDLSTEGTQPMFDVERELVIAFNGEIYNYRELRAALERGGARFHSHTDTEVLLQLYRRDGERMLGLLRGMFAFAIWDTRARTLFAARDPYGIKPLYFADDGGTFRFASEVKALMAGGAVSSRRDPAAVAGFFLTGTVPEPFTIREEIRALEAGTCLRVDERGRTEARRYHSIAATYARATEQRSIARLTEPEIFLRERVDESIAHHLVADVPVAVFLSSGIDSSAIAQIATRIASAPLRTFTLTFDEFGGTQGDEAPLAERFARELGTIHTTRTVTRDEFTRDLPRILERMDQPTIDGVNTWFVSKAVAEAGVKVVLSGLGGDELFGSYSSFTNLPRLVKLARIPGIGAGVRIAARAGLGHPKLRLLRKFGSSYAGAYLLQRGLFMPDELPALIGADVAEEGLRRLDFLERAQQAMRPDPATPFGRVAALEASLYMRNQLLRDSDWASMSHSVEVRTPLVDASLLRQLGPVLVDRGRECKAAFAASLPSWLRERRKTGFFVPMKEWMHLPPDGTTTRMKSWARVVWERVG